MGQQLKCIELSILFSVGLGAAATALFASSWFTSASGPQAGSRYAVAAGILLLYSLLQEALLANYVFQTWLIHRVVAYIIAATGTSHDGASFEPGQWEKVAWVEERLSSLPRGPVPWAVNLFQCGIPYLSVLLGCGCTVWVLAAYPGMLHGYVYVLWGGWLVAIGLLLFVGFVHLRLASPAWPLPKGAP